MSAVSSYLLPTLNTELKKITTAQALVIGQHVLVKSLLCLLLGAHSQIVFGFPAWIAAFTGYCRIATDLSVVYVSLVMPALDKTNAALNAMPNTCLNNC